MLYDGVTCQKYYYFQKMQIFNKTYVYSVSLLPGSARLETDIMTGKHPTSKPPLALFGTVDVTANVTASGSARAGSMEETGAISPSMVGIRTIHAGAGLGEL